MKRTKFDLGPFLMLTGSMQFFMPSGQEPVTWWKDRPIHLALILVLAHLAAMVVTGILQAAGAYAILEHAVLTRSGLLSGEIWRLVSFPLVQFVSPSGGAAGGAFWTLIGLFFLWYFGLAMELVMGWRKLLKFYLILCLSPVLVILALPYPFSYFGTQAANFAVFIGFCTMNPEAPMIFNTKAKWWAWGLIFIVALQGLSNHDLLALIPLVASAVAYLYLRSQGVGGGFAWLNRWREEREEARVERVQTQRVLESKEHFISDQVDPILDKIGREGMQSLTEEEKRILARAKDKLR